VRIHLQLGMLRNGSTGARRGVAALASAALVAALAVGLIGCQSDGASSKKPQSQAELAKDAEAQDAFDAGAGKPPTPQTLYALARILTAKGDVSQAIGVLRNLIQRYPKYSPAYNALAEAYLSVDRTDDAISALTAGVTRAPKDPVLLNNLGMVYFMDGDYESALAYFDRAVAVAPAEPMYTSNKAAALGMLGRVADSAELYRKHLRKADAFENVQVLMRARKVVAREASAAPQEQGGRDNADSATTQPSAAGDGVTAPPPSAAAQ
jgi:tetratricopeptide (TPR) repeat protein